MHSLRPFAAALLAVVLAGCFQAPAELLLTPLDSGVAGGTGGGGGLDAGVDECALALDDCHAHATCTDTAAGFTCACETGYAGDGKSCAPVGSQLAAGGAHTCEVRGGELWCWGGNSIGQLGLGVTGDAVGPTRVGAGADWLQVAAGYASSCGARRDGTAACWGDNSQGQLGDGTTTARSAPVPLSGSWKQVSVGGNTGCGVKQDESAWCWGGNWYGKLGDGSGVTVGQRSTPGPVAAVGTSRWRSLAVSAYHVCGVQTDGSLWCWGEGRFGELGGGAVVGQGQYSPSRVGVDLDWSQVHVSVYVTCAFKQSGARYCFGSNWYGRYGDGNQTVGQYAPTASPDAAPWRTFSMGDAVACGIRADGSLWCWGMNAEGGVGDGTTTNRFAPVQVGAERSWLSVATGTRHTCAARVDGSRWCWGRATSGQLGREPSSAPVAVGGSTWSLAGAGADRSLGLRADGRLFSWGVDSSGAAEQAPKELSAGSTWATVSGSSAHACGVRSDGELWCWGGNTSGQLGNGATGASLPPGRVALAGARWLSVAAGTLHTCAIRDDFSLWCWGAGESGQLGDGLATSHPAPARVGTGTWASVSAGQQHTCGVQRDGSLWCWGSNQGGRAGLGPDGTTQQARSPTRVGSASWREVTAGQLSSCGLQSDGSLWCWGVNVNGQVGDGSTTSRTEPVRIGANADWSHVSVNQSSCATRAGTLWCWGPGLLGGGDVKAPQQVGADLTWSAVAVGVTHACGTRADGTLWCWGRNNHGELGDGSAWFTSPRAL